jgi:hypothetical protein
MLFGFFCKKHLIQAKSFYEVFSSLLGRKGEGVGFGSPPSDSFLLSFLLFSINMLVFAIFSFFICYSFQSNGSFPFFLDR